MVRKLLLPFALLLPLLLVTGCEQAQHSAPAESVETSLEIANLKVGEGFTNPLGYYEATPRFSWQLSDSFSGNFQSAYQLQVASSESFASERMLWDSHKVVSDQSSWVRYQGDKLQSRQKVYWRVKVWNENDQASLWSQTQSLELGLLESDDWQAKWIGHPETGERDTSRPKDERYRSVGNLLYRPQYLRTEFTVKGDVEQARLYITSKGVFKPFMNGEPISQDAMTPGWTPYHKRIETLTYDVTRYLNQGANALGAIVAEGWHTGRIFHPVKQEYLLPMRLIAQLEISYKDGSRQLIASDEKWQASVNGPIRAAGNYDGESYDAHFEMPGWHKPSFEVDEKWQPVVVEPIDPYVALAPKRHAPVRATLTIPAVSIVSVKDGVAIYDMGQNMVGVPAIKVPVLADQEIKLRFSEALEGEHFHVKNLRSAKSTDYYRAKESGVIEYQPGFTFHGYRYVELSGYDPSQTPQLNWIQGKVLHSDFEVFDNFTSSHDKLNQLSENVAWGLRGNFLDIPTDCPQRDERLGWTGDAQVFAATSMYKADVYGFWSAWLQSVREDQGIDGMVPKFVPFRQFLTDGTAAAWGDVATILPWDLYQMTGDKNVLAENYTLMKRWLKYHEVMSYQLISNMGTYGDWLQPFSTHNRAKGDTHPDLIATAYFARSADLLARAARVLGYHSDAMQYEALFANISNKFRQFFFDEQLNLVAEAEKLISRDGSKRLRKPQAVTIKPKATQTSYLLPLAFGLFEPEDEQIAIQKLMALIEQSDGHLRTGFLGTPLLHDILQKFNHSDVMYGILFKESYPSWFYSINHGATTTWERWNSYSLTDGFNKANMNSLNHYAYGAVAKWFYEGMLGIKATQPGFKTFEVAPQFNPRLSHASGGYKTPHGEIQVNWEIKQQSLDMELVIPKNSQAKLNLPQVDSVQLFRDGEKVTNPNELLNPGRYKIKGELNF